ncbi:hypothetical protein [Bradyrhizobium sp.]|uniref:hypothetical protein n=1 Tax=Bradyrhizobium sp. TaxID=376 RepID=UPI001DB302A6|nr:hypothetical protein [Bradyrhizobium sp.]MBV8698941.1 hypothetical protein [Bradyrhizobium sp.]MBV8922054.1 hypothetical protein [Bradyrhizobium sp.]
MVFTSRSSSATLPLAEDEVAGAVAGNWRRPVAAFVLAFASVWLALDMAYIGLPFIRPGSVVIADGKFETLVTGRMFDPQDRYRVMIFGHSKALTAARPRELDATMGAGFRSYNLGLPGEVHFLPILKAALEAGNVPTHVLLTLPWDGKRDRDGLIDALHNDAAIAKVLLPFRTLPRDATLFVFENRKRLIEAIHDVAIERSRMLEERGWYFIKSQSHYEDDRLPDDYALPTDQPTHVASRPIPEQSFTRTRLEQLARQYGFQILLIPLPYRTGEFARAPAADAGPAAIIADQPPIRVLGPAYFSYPPALFADPQHTNPQGASVYTADLARLLKGSGAFR